MYIILGVLFIIVLFLIFLYNRLIKLNMRVKNAYAGIDNQLKRRADLIPNLVEVTKGYAKYESETLERLVLARTSTIEQQARQSEEISKSLQKLLALSEAYPDLKASEVFSNLQVELTGTEDKIAYARQFYNDCVQHFNTAIQTFPNNIMASILKYEEKPYFQINDDDRKNVDIKL